MDTINDVHLQFASYFRSREIAPYLYLLSQKIEEGSTCLDLSVLDEEITENFPFDIEKYSKENLSKDALVGSDSILDRPFIMDRERLYLQRYFQYEINLIQKIRSMVQQDDAPSRVKELVGLKKNFDGLFPIEETSKIDWQKVAAFFALLNDFTIITGGPGTGKTTTVSKILELCLLLNPNATIALAAPTGKAAARMTESLRNAASRLSEETRKRFSELQPSTIHRLLETIKDSLYFKHNHTNPLHYDIIVVDECSMIDIALFSKLLDAIGPHSKLILLGDKDQLSSVEVGSLFGDLCKTVRHLNLFSKDKVELFEQIFSGEKLEEISGADFLQNNIIELRESRRFDKEKGIGKLANAVIENDQDALDVLLDDKSETQIIFDFDRSETIWKDFAKKYVDYIKEENILKALQKLDQQRVLCAVREGDFGTEKMNQKIENYLSSLLHIDSRNPFYEHRPIMVMQNNYELGLYNGDIGLLRKDVDGAMKVWFIDSENVESGLKSVLPGLISDMKTVFAMTIHKSQGSEFNHVMVVLPENNQSSEMLTREILYTAITRAKESVCISASASTIKDITMRQVQRSSGVSVRL